MLSSPGTINSIRSYIATRCITAADGLWVGRQPSQQIHFLLRAQRLHVAVPVGLQPLAPMGSNLGRVEVDLPTAGRRTTLQLRHVSGLAQLRAAGHQRLGVGRRPKCLIRPLQIAPKASVESCQLLVPAHLATEGTDAEAALTSLIGDAEGIATHPGRAYTRVRAGG